MHVTLHGGEPLAAGYDVIQTIVTRLKSELGDVDISIQSNLWLLDARLCALFARHNVGIGTSIDGPCHINDAQRGQGYYERTMRGIARAKSHGLSVGCIASFTDASAAQWHDVLNFFTSHHLNFSFHPVVPAKDHPSPLAMSKDQYAALFDAMMDEYLGHLPDVKDRHV